MFNKINSIYDIPLVSKKTGDKFKLIRFNVAFQADGQFAVRVLTKNTCTYLEHGYYLTMHDFFNRFKVKASHNKMLRKHALSLAINKMEK